MYLFWEGHRGITSWVSNLRELHPLLLKEVDRWCLMLKKNRNKALYVNKKVNPREITKGIESHCSVKQDLEKQSG